MKMHGHSNPCTQVAALLGEDEKQNRRGSFLDLAPADPDGRIPEPISFNNITFRFRPSAAITMPHSVSKSSLPIRSNALVLRKIF